MNRRPVFDRHFFSSIAIVAMFVGGGALIAAWLAQPHGSVIVSSLTVETK